MTCNPDINCSTNLITPAILGSPRSMRREKRRKEEEVYEERGRKIEAEVKIMQERDGRTAAEAAQSAPEANYEIARKNFSDMGVDLSDSGEFEGSCLHQSS